MTRIEDDNEAQRQQERLAERVKLEERRSKDAVQKTNEFANRIKTQNEAQKKDARIFSKAAETQKGESLVKTALSLKKSEDAEVAARQLNQSHSEGDVQKEEMLEHFVDDDHEQTDVSDQTNKNQNQNRVLQQDQHAAMAENKSAQARFNKDKQGEAEHQDDKQNEKSEEHSAKGSEKKQQRSPLSQNATGGFRLNPALLAPAPLAQPKDTHDNERFRKMAAEIAQKIVERVRVGKNAEGKAEFQIDFRSDVLNGLQVKVSSSRGRISAVFSGADRNVSESLRENVEGLRKALLARGLDLEEFKIEGA